MKTLLERAKPELKKAIAMFKVDYPNTADHVESLLRENYIVSDLPYGTIIDMGAIIKSSKLKFDLNFPWEYFEEQK